MRLTEWLDQKFLALLPDRGKRNMAYTKPGQNGEQPSLLSELEDSNGESAQN